MTPPKRSTPPVNAENAERRRQIAKYALFGVVLLFVAQLVVLSLGMIEYSLIILGVMVLGWFVLRSYQKRYPL